jgi:hypothetical protein
MNTTYYTLLTKQQGCPAGTLIKCETEVTNVTDDIIEVKLTAPYNNNKILTVPFSKLVRLPYQINDPVRLNDPLKPKEQNLTGIILDIYANNYYLVSINNVSYDRIIYESELEPISKASSKEFTEFSGEESYCPFQQTKEDILENKMTISVEESIDNYGKRGIIIKEFRNVKSYFELPNQYYYVSNGYPVVYKQDDHIVIWKECETPPRALYIDQVVPEKEWEELLLVISQAAKRLKEINKKLSTGQGLDKD